MKNKAALSLVAGVALSAAALYFALRNVPAAELMDYLRRIDVSWMAVSIAVGLMGFGVRALRWQVILGPRTGVGFWQAYHPLVIGFMINCVLPGRVGEVARPVILRQRTGVPFATGIATVAAERVFDIVMLIGLFAGVMGFIRIDPDLSIAFGDYQLNQEMLMGIFQGMVNLSLLLIAGIVLVGFERTRGMIRRWILAAPGLLFFTQKAFQDRVRERVCRPLTGLLEKFADGFSQVKDPGTLALCLALSVATWGIAAASYFAMSLGCPGVTLTFPEIAAMMVIICFFIALPSVPGYWGIWEAAGMFVLYLFGVEGKDAAGFTLANHAVQVIPVVLLGLVSAMITGVDIFKVSRQKDRGTSEIEMKNLQ